MTSRRRRRRWAGLLIALGLVAGCAAPTEAPPSATARATAPTAALPTASPSAAASTGAVASSGPSATPETGTKPAAAATAAPAATVVPTTAATATSSAAALESGAGRPVAAGPSLLVRRDAPPGGVASQFQFGGGAGEDWCDFAADAPASTHPDVPDCVAEVNHPVTLSFSGFAPGQKIAIEVRGPDGALRPQESVRADRRGRATREWLGLPGDPLGRHAVAAVQGTRRAGGTLELRPSSVPSKQVVPASGPPGTTFRVMLAGFAPGQQVPLYLYGHRGREEHYYVTSLGAATIDARGQAIVPLPTRSDDPWLEYAVTTEPSVGPIRSGRFGLAMADELVLRRADAPPAGVPSVLPLTEDAPSCLGTPLPAGGDSWRGQAELGAEGALCLRGFAPGQDVKVEAKAQEEGADLGSARADGQGEARLADAVRRLVRPGEYAVTAVQGSRKAVGRLSIAPASRPRLAAPSRVVAGDRLAVALAGFPPRERVTLRLYRRAGGAACGAAGCWSYLTSLPSTIVDGDGGTIREIPIAPDDRWGEYRLVADPPADGPFDRFEVRGTRASLLGGGAAPPPGVPATLPDTPAQQCAGPLRPGAPLDVGAAELGAETALCLQGFRPGRGGYVRVDVKGPGDELVGLYAARIDPQGAGRVRFAVPPGSPTGRYTIAVGDGPGRALATMRMSAPSAPRLGMLSGRLPLPNPVTLVLAGFAPGQPVTLRLYRRGGPEGCPGAACWRYVSSLPTIALDANGEERLELYGAADDPPGTYLVVAATDRGAALSTRFEAELIPEDTPDTSAEDQARIKAIATDLIGRAEELWAAALGRDGVPAADLGSVFAGPALAEARRSVQEMRDRGQYRVARLRSPMTLRAAEQLNNRRIDADVTEDWSDVLHERDGAVARDLSGRLERHYVLESVADGWRIIEARPAVPG